MQAIDGFHVGDRLSEVHYHLGIVMRASRGGFYEDESGTAAGRAT